MMVVSLAWTNVTTNAHAPMNHVREKANAVNALPITDRAESFQVATFQRRMKKPMTGQ
jgi:hypothetical protein